MEHTHSISTTATNRDTIEERAAEVHDLRAKGVLTDAEARRELAALVEESNIHLDVAKGSRITDETGRNDVANDLRELTIRKLLMTEDNCYDFERGRGASLKGWARNLQRAALPSVERPYLRYRNRNLLETDAEHIYSGGDDDTPFSNSVMDSMAARHTSSATPMSDAAKTDDDVPSLLDEQPTFLRKYQSETERTHAATAWVVGLTGLPFPHRLTDPAERKETFNLIMGDPYIAGDSASILSTMARGGKLADCNELMMKVWESYTCRDLESLLGDARAWVPIIALSAVAPLSQPSQANRMKMIRFLASHASKSTRTTFRPLIVRLVESFLAREAEPFSSHNNTLTEADKEALTEQATKTASRFSDDVRAVRDFPGAPLGSTGEVIFQALTDSWRQFALQKSRNPQAKR